MLTAAVLLFFAVLLVIVFAHDVTQTLANFADACFRDSGVHSTRGAVSSQAAAAFDLLVDILSPILIGIFLCAFVVASIQAAPYFLFRLPRRSRQSVGILSNVNFQRGLGQLLVLLGAWGVCAVFIVVNLPRLMSLSSSLQPAVSLIVELLLWLAIYSTAVGLLHIFFLHWRRLRRLRMTPHEARTERRQQHGDPQVRSYRRRLQRQDITH